eukprot:scaffold1355_cov268-Pinguiococcus_pyrenoidosus.AAC.39
MAAQAKEPPRAADSTGPRRENGISRASRPRDGVAAALESSARQEREATICRAAEDGGRVL